MSTCTLSRRQFGLSLCGVPFSSALLAQEFQSMPWNSPATVARVYLGGAAQWPKPTLDLKAEIAEIEARLAEVQRKHPQNVKLTGGDLLGSDAQVKPWLEKMGDIDGVLIIPLTQPTPALGLLVNELKVPALFFSRPYATHSWSVIAAMQ
jgi:hypothetical protein